MKINSKDTIAGFPLLRIRDLLKRSDYFTPESLAYFLKISTKAARAALKEFAELGYIKMYEVKPVVYSKTTKGNALALARAVGPISKEKAENIFREFMGRVNKVNQDPDFIYKVSKVLLFGSYITDATLVNDIDVAVEIVRKDDDYDTYKIKHDIKIKELENNGKYFGGLIPELMYPLKEVILFLKARSKYISIHMADDQILKQTEVKQVYSD